MPGRPSTTTIPSARILVRLDGGDHVPHSMTSRYGGAVEERRLIVQVAGRE
ncbi:hypothetical protein AB0331_17850 [Dietzia maris]|uniref:hypothetical protein n=1 Tax=Dietzia maris TaxID=37915 RepID=UPI00344F08B2